MASGQRASVSIATKIDPHTARSGLTEADEFPILNAQLVLPPPTPAQGWIMRAIIEYLRHAIQCRTQAERVAQPRDKKILEELAEAWEKIAALREQDVVDAKDTTQRNDRLV
jgi:uncharacterized protein YmfQ (DUF2313 family)